MMPLLIGLALSTLISEDLASIAAGLLARNGHVPLIDAVIACTIGVYVGDLGLWAVGRALGSRALRHPWLSRAFASLDVTLLRSEIETRLGIAIFVSRFVPGCRLPMYVAIGVWGQRPLAFAIWSLLAVLAWTPMLVLATLYFGDASVMRAVTGIRAGVLGALITATLMLGVTKLAARCLARLMRHYHHRLAHTIETPT